MNKQHLTASNSIKETERRPSERHMRTVCLTGWTEPVLPPHPPTYFIHPPNDVWPVRETPPNYIQDYKAFVRGFLFLCNTLQNNNWDSAAANCTKISHSLSVNY